MKPHDRPTLAELRQRAHKPDHREIGNWLARRWARPAAIPGTWLALRLGLSAHQVTLLALAVGLAGSCGIGSGSRSGFVLGTGLLFLSFWLDRVDGQVARWRGTSSLDGVYLDYLMHHVLNLSLGFALGFGLAMRTGALAWAAVGMAIGSGWLLLGLHNDCRYKAFFERLKHPGVAYLLRGGAVERPSPPAGWPRRGLGLATWPAAKACEPHVVLMALALLSLVSLLAPELWSILWKASAAGMAVLAPALAAGRVLRFVRAGRVEDEFRHWFQVTPCEAPPEPAHSR